MKNILTRFAALLLVSSLARATDADWLLENAHLKLRLDARTGNWVSLIDRRSGEERVTGRSPHAAVAPAGVARIDLESVRQALSNRQAIALMDGWRYTPNPPAPEVAARFPQGSFDGAAWAPTPVPSRRGVGDDLLRERVGDFWYRCEFLAPAHWPEAPLALVIGAVDDLDETWLNGQRIGRTGVGTPHHWETPRCYAFPFRLLRRGQTNSLLLKVTNGAFDGGISGPVVIGLATALPVSEAEVPAISEHSLKQEADGQRLELVSRQGDFEYRVGFVLRDNARMFTRQMAVRNVSDQEQLFQTGFFRTPPLSVGAQQSVIFPGSLPAGDQLAATLSDDEPLRPRSEEPLVVLWDSKTQQGLGSWFHCEEEYAPASVLKRGAGVEISHAQGIVVRLKPGATVALGTQYFWLADGSRDAALRGIQEVYRAIGLSAPTNGLPGLRDRVVYCGHPGGTPELDFLRYGGFRALERYVPTLRRMHVGLLWLLPIWEHGDGLKWNLYSPFDHYQVDHLLGTAEELKSLSRACASNGIRLLFDLVPHGPPEFTPLARQHPEWIARTPDGKYQMAWNQVAFDNHHPGWQDYMGRAAEWGAREFGAVGARVDCGAGGPLNWNRAVTDRPSLSSLAGGLGMNQSIRAGYERVHQAVVVLPEEYTGANIFNRVADLTYDSQFYFLHVDLLERNAPPAEWAATLQQFLHDQQQTLPLGALKMRWISNHDTVRWAFQKQRPAKAYGVERMRALLALCALIEGVPMLYQGDEDPGVYGGQGQASVDFLERLYGLRKEIKALREGIADYTAVQASDGVFAALRGQNQETTLVLISLNPQPVTSSLAMPAQCQGVWADRLSGEVFKFAGTHRMAMRPFQVRVLVRDGRNL